MRRGRPRHGRRADLVAGRDRSCGTGGACSVHAGCQQGGGPMTGGAMIGGATMCGKIAATLIFPAALLQAIPQTEDYIRILPELVLSAFGIVIMVLEPLLDEEKSQKLLGFIALLGAVAGIAATWVMSGSPGLAFSKMVKVDSFSVFFHVLVIAI